MFERIVENWLTRAGEKGYQTPFTQLLSIEGHRVLQGPAHFPFEHGKDMITLDPERKLNAFQLKGGDQNLENIEAIEPQLLALAAGAVTYPGVEPPRRPDRVALVVSGTLTPPARDRIANFNHANRALGIGPIEVIEKEQLVARFVAAQGGYLPTEPTDLSNLLKFYLSDGKGPFPMREVLALIADIVKPRREKPPNTEFARSIGSSLLLTAYAVAPWQRTGNHLAVAEAWLALSSGILRVASEMSLSEEIWKESYDLAFGAGRAALRELLDECAAADDLTIPDLVEGVVYPTRALLVCGYLSAFYLSERELGTEAQIAEPVKKVLRRELQFIKMIGESGAPYALSIGTALELQDEAEQGRLLVARYAASLARANQNDSNAAIPDPYHSFEDCLKRIAGADVALMDEQFDGNAYTLHVALEWLARRAERDVVTDLWPLATRLTLCEFRPSSPAKYLSHKDEEGVLKMWQANTPQSWKSLTEAARALQESEVPGELWRNTAFLPYLCLLLPHRLTSAIAKAQDSLVAQELVAISLDMSAPGETSGVGEKAGP